MKKSITKIPRCQRIQNEYKENFYILQEVINAIELNQSIGMEMFIKCMEFLYREGWGDCFMWQGEVPGETTMKEFLKILPIKRYGRNS